MVLGIDHPELWKQFDHKTQDTLPSDVVLAAWQNGLCRTQKYSLQPAQLSWADQVLRDNLVKEGKRFKDETVVYRLKMVGEERYIYYGADGRRLGDGIGINDWFLRR